MRTRIVSFAAAFLIVGCTETTRIDLNAERLALTETVEAYYHGLSALRSDVAQLYADDALVLRPGRADLTGRDALDEFVIGINETPGFDVGFETRFVEISQDATLGYSMAIVRVVREGENGERFVERNRDLHLWRKADDGSWKLVLDIWNEAPPER